MNDTVVKFPISSACEYDTIKKDGTPWQPKLFRRAPWLGLLALLGALLGVLAAAVVLYISNGKPTENWSIKPTVYLAICSAITNILVHFSFTQAMTVAWWKRAIQTEATIADLHRSWDHGQNLWAALTAGRHFSLVALASILVALAPINGPLLQRASQIEEMGEKDRLFNAKIDIATEIPEGFTGYTSGQDHMPVLLTPNFTYIVVDWNSQAGIKPQYQTGCWGKCLLKVPGAGFFTDCVNSTFPFRLPSSAKASTTGLSQSEEFDPSEYGTDIFATEFVWAGGKFNLNVQYKESNDCGGSLMVRNCTFNPAIIISDVTILNDERSVDITISQTVGQTVSDDRLVRLVELAPDSGGSNTKSDLNTSTYGGLFKAVQDAYTSSVRLSHGPSGYQVSTAGSLGNLFWGIQDDAPHSYGKRSELPGLDCSMSFRDPTDYIKNGVRDLMFRTAMFRTPPFRNFDYDPLKKLDEGRIPVFPAYEFRTLPVFKSSYLFLGLAIFVSLLAWFATILVFWGWWHLGRAFSMSPVETAKAFGAPGLRSSDSNADARGILKEVGEKDVRYGVVTTSTFEGFGGEVKQRTQLVIGDAERVRKPRRGETFVN